MKIRLDFVTNSSSSSFVCECCGNVEGGYDVCMEDVGMVQCQNEHILCEHHITTERSFKDEKNLLIQSIKETIDYYSKKDGDFLQKIVSLTDELNFVTELKESDIEDDYDMEEKYKDLLSYYDLESTILSSNCPLCNHTHVTDRQMLDYALEKLNMKEKEFKEVVREYLIEKDKQKC